MCLAGCTPRTAAAPGRGALPRARLPRSALAAATMFQPTAKRGFTIESLVAKDGGTGGGTGGGGAGSHPLAAAASEEPLRPTALNYPHPGAAEAAFVSGFPAAAAAAAGAGRSLYGGPELVFPEAMNHPALTVHPAHQLGASPLQPPHSFFGAQHRDPLHFYPWVLRNRFFGHRFQVVPGTVGLGWPAPLQAWAHLRAQQSDPQRCNSERPPTGERRAPGRAASARPLRAQAQADPHGLLALAAAATGARLREEPLRGGRRAEAAGRQPQPLGDAGEGVVPEPEDEVQAAEAGGGGAGVRAEEEGLPPHQPVAHRHEAGQRGGHRCHLQ
nr:homeobox protein EMX1 isoform X1 [Equus asinus]